ncbi:hypothetical protein BJY16_006122 [Actinoplanes octamycinicus]|uniref:Uncharacterized protein n=1 Tax=Actinoplanes octamycinicus TaxID=135948 RepID=A0A7W7H287_9ACTN|nr:hypothetical protein [Actinoplanes octamycinicus]MBB4742663.1 hypothetical protein [Actinoplanes octamycinicus]GIE61001.1 hypothetical protein Aoc01nite_64030 [Actinoplanes octamycinicus]
MAGTVEALLLKVSDEGRARLTPPTVDLAAGTGLVLLPLTEEITEGLPGDGVVDGFYELTTGVADWARDLSRYGTVAYLHSEFFGGGGFHAAIAWRDGAVAWGPMFTATSAGEAEEHYTVAADRHQMAANVLLRWLGVHRGDAIDEYAAAGLTNGRWTKDWASQAAP